MADLRSILTDPNYTGANAATKRAIFERYSAQDPNYVNANEATKQAIQAKYGVSVVAAAPAAAPMSVEAMQEQAMAATDLPAAPAAAPAPQREFIGQSIPQAITAPIELAATGLTGATTGLLGYAAGAGAGVMESIRNGTYGTRVGGQQMAQRAMQGLERYTYAPRTELAQQALQSVGELAAEAKLAPVPVGAGLQALTGPATAQAARAVVPVAGISTRAVSPARVEPSVGPESPAAVQALEQQFQVLTPEQQMQRMGMPAAQQPEVPTTAAPTVAETTAAFDELGALVRKASSEGIGSSTAKAKLADAAQVNTDARAAAERLGIDLPFDVFSDNPQIRAAVGLTRSQAGGEAEAAWQTTLANAINRADEVVQQFDAAFIEGRVAPGATSQRILDNLKGTQDQLAQESSAIYKRVDEAIPKTSTVQFPRLGQTLDEVMAEVGEKGLTAQEKKLYELATDPTATYGRLLREKNLIGQAVSGKESPYGNMDAASLKRLYAALAEDQLTNVGSIAGEAVRKELRAANLLTAKKKALEKRIVGAFGKEIDGSVANLMQSAIKSASKGDAAQFNKLMKVVPQELQKETIATAIAAVSSSNRAGQDGAFGFSEFAKTYRGLRANPPVYKKVVEILGPEADVVLRDLYEVSKRITDARANVLTTGKANQALVESLRSEGIIGKVMQTTMAQRAVTGVASMFPAAGFFAPDIINFMTRANSDAVKAAGKLFASKDFQKLAIQAATKTEVSEDTLKQAANSQEFRTFAKFAKLPKSLNARIDWLRSALRSEPQQEQK